MYQTLILVIWYFYRFLGILNEFSVREHWALRVVDLRRPRGAYTCGGRHCCCAQNRDSGRSEHTRGLGQAAPGCHQIVDEHSCAGRDRPPQPVGAGEVLLAGGCAQAGLISNPPRLSQRRSNRHGVAHPKLAGGKPGHRGGGIEPPPTDRSRC